MIKNVRAKCNLGDSDHEIIEFMFLRKKSNRIEAKSFRRADFNKLRELVGRIFWKDQCAPRAVINQSVSS